MNALIVFAHPNRHSLVRAVAQAVERGLTEGGAAAVELADLAAERFDPRFTPEDIALHAQEGPAPADVAAEQRRLDRADDLILVYPVYWWSLPALLKGWIDRVFANGWAYDYAPETGVIKRLGRLRVHLVAVGGADLRTYARYGYFGAMRTQIERGVFDYCGAQVMTSELLLAPSDGDWERLLKAAHDQGRRIAAMDAARQAA